MKNDMFYGATDLIFEKANALRNSMTEAEQILWNYLKEGQSVVTFTRQHPASLYVLDFYCHELKLVIEIDGNSDDVDAVKKNNEERQKKLESLGLKTVRFFNDDVVQNSTFVINKIHSLIKNNLQNHQAVSNALPGAVGLEIIPAIDIIDGKCVRLTQGDYDQKKIYNEHPLEVARQFEDAGLKRLHLVDLDGAKAGAVKNWKVLETIASKTGMIIDFGGGIKKEKDLDIVFNSGAAFATIGSMAVKDETTFVEWIKHYGAEKFLLGADVKDEKIAIGGWLETTDIWIYDFIEKYIAHGIQQIFCTDVSKDGLLEGPSVELYKEIVDRFPNLFFIASGGVSNRKDLEDLQAAGCKGVIIGKAIYENRISLKELKSFNV